MLQQKSRRGRPKGTGLDDRSRLEAVALILKSNPTLKPTTAIKSLGVSDPSVIRRLRDKYHLAKGELMADVRTQKGATPAKTKAVAAKVQANVSEAITKAVTAEPPRVSAASDAVAQPQSAPARPSEPRTSLSASSGALVAWYGLGWQTWTSAVGFQLSMVEQMMRLPQIAGVLRNHVALNELTMSLCPRPAPRPFLH